MLKVNHKKARISGFCYYQPAGTGKKPVLQTHKFIPGLNKVENEVWDSIWKEVKRAQGLDVYEALIEDFEVLHDDTKSKKEFNPMNLSKDKMLSYIEGEMDLDELLKFRVAWKKSKKRNRDISMRLDGKIEEIQTLDKIYKDFKS